jgi:hypothetical protein
MPRDSKSTRMPSGAIVAKIDNVTWLFRPFKDDEGGTGYHAEASNGFVGNVRSSEMAEVFGLEMAQ